MSQREYEVLPEAPDLGEYVQEDTAETLVGPPESEPLDAGYVPPDRPYVVDDDQALSSTPEDLDGRLRRERPDVDPDSGESVADNEPDRAPRFAPGEPTEDSRYTEPVEAVDEGFAGGAASAEEAAMHERDVDDTPS